MQRKRKEKREEKIEETTVVTGRRGAERRWCGRGRGRAARGGPPSGRRARTASPSSSGSRTPPGPRSSSPSPPAPSTGTLRATQYLMNCTYFNIKSLYIYYNK